jgi:Leucine-rich repeat (LRR) protein
MVERPRYCPCTSHGFLFLVASFVLFLLRDASVAAAAAVAPPSLLPLDENQAHTMAKLLTIVGSKWNTTSNPCGWSGVTCRASHSSPSSVVKGITLSNYAISNRSIFNPICFLNTLQILDLSKNSLKGLRGGIFPSSCSFKEELRFLNLSGNQLARPISDLSGFSRLEVLDLSSNYFTSGDLSAELTYFETLRSLNLSFNQLNGTVPFSMAGFVAELVLSGNQLTGSIPARLFTYQNLTTLDLSQNDLTGPVPDEFMRLSKLENLLLSENSLTGEVPESLSNVTTLYRFAANQNSFTGPIPSRITNHVKMLDLSYNHLNGTIPPHLLSGPRLQTVDLTSNMLQGTILYSSSQSLYRLRLGGNNLVGNIPHSICDGMSLTSLELDNNRLSGTIPSELGKCKSLSLLNLASNQLQGSIPVDISSLDKLVVLKLQGNKLSGHIPGMFSDLTVLNTLNLSQNSFTGVIPSEIFGLQKLSTLDLHENNITGAIPSSVSSSKSLIELNLGHNALTGTIPAMPTTLSTALNLSHNYLVGHIPSNIVSLKDLEILDLSYNNLSGEVPSSLVSLQSLTQLVLSYNNLSGSVPRFGQFVEVNVTGNPYLANGTGENHGTPTGKRRTHNVLVIIFAIAGALIVLCLLAVIVMISLSKKIYRVEDERLHARHGASQIINGRLITMNSIHASAIDFMRALEAVTNNQNIFLKTRFCTYYKAVMPNGSTYSVKRLNWSEKIFQIGSQEKLGHELEILGKLSNSNVMVPLAYVLTEENAYLLYEHVYKGTVFDFLHGGKSEILDWPSRYSIALGVAQGLTFLHGCTQPVLLLDLSTRTIHLKMAKEPQIGDIELYKIIDPYKSTGSLSTIAGTVGYIPPGKTDS